MKIALDKLRRHISNCDPDAPLKDRNDTRYVAFDEGHGVRGDDGSVVEILERTILLSDSSRPTCQLFTGFPGAGKTTELFRLQRALEGTPMEKTRVLFVDAEQYFDRYSPPTISDMLRVLAFHFDNEALRAEDRDPEKSHGYLHRLWQWLQSDVDLKRIGFDAYGQKLMFEIRNNPSFRQRARAALDLRFQEFAREAQNVIDDAIQRIRQALGVERIVLIVDGLEKFTSLNPGDRPAMEASIEAVFVTHAELLRLPCHTIYTFPLWLRFRTGDLGARFDSPPLTLPMVKVRDRAGTDSLPGIDKLAEMIERRILGIEEVFGSDWRTRLLPIIKASGGYPRDLLRMVRETMRRAREFPVDAATVERVIDLLAEEYKMVTLLADLDVIAHIGRTNALPSGAEQVRAASWLFERWLVLTWRNGEEWYDLHPLVRRADLVQSRLARADAK